ncbi:MAG: amidohydrolase family protein, partial [Hyphomicrobiales bacterium]|nr:amidohydrolase family protein [Hyphomicrobiales bacterium]
EVEDCVSWSGARPVEWLLAHAPVDRRWCLVHATHMTREETRAVASAGAVAGLCPITEANLGDGTFNASEFIEYGGEFGIGSDSHVFIGVADELRQLEYSQRLRHRARNVMAQEEGRSTGRTLYERALVGGTRALGEAKFGLAEGARADFLSLDAEHPALVGRAGDALLDAFIFAAPGSIVDCVWRAGEKLVQGGRHRRREAILARFRAAMGRLLA